MLLLLLVEVAEEDVEGAMEAEDVLYELLVSSSLEEDALEVVVESLSESVLDDDEDDDENSDELLPLLCLLVLRFFAVDDARRLR